MKVAVILPAYNPNSKWLDDAIMSVLNQKTSHDLKLFVWFDGADNGYIPPDDSRIIILKDNTRRGLSGGLNYIINHVIGLSWNCRYDYIARIDADDMWHEDKIERQINHMIDKKISVCGTWGILIKDDGSVKSNTWEYANHTDDINMLFMKTPTSDFFIDPSVVFNAKLIYDGLVHYNNAMLGGADYELWLRLAAMNIKMGSIPERLYLYRTHSGEQNTRSIQWQHTMRACFSRIAEMYKELNKNMKYFVKSDDCI